MWATPVYAADSVYMEELTSPEIRKLIDSGAITAIIPTGGSEQNGQHMVIGKHNTIVHYTAGEIARKLGNALVAPVIAYVPEGGVEPPQGHMQFAGTISVSEETYAAVLKDAASSLKQHGFKLICFLGDSGGNQLVQKKLAQELTQQWKDKKVRVLQVSDYYDNNGQDAWVNSLKLPIKNPGEHAGFEDTSELMAIDAGGVRKNLLGNHSNAEPSINGVSGDSTLASSKYGSYLLNLKITAAVEQIQHALKP
jgi:creatinine amidohydrolase/Fe(II)-dependent formamide hydrolase-like protein